MGKNSPEYIKDYMRDYVNKAETETCDLCQGEYKAYNKYRHKKAKKHINAMNLLNRIKDLKTKDQ